MKRADGVSLEWESVVIWDHSHRDAGPEIAVVKYRGGMHRTRKSTKDKEEKKRWRTKTI